MKNKNIFLVIAFLCIINYSCEKENTATIGNLPDGAILLTTEGLEYNTKTSVSGSSVQWVSENDSVILNNIEYAVHVNNSGQAYIEDCEISGMVYGYYPSQLSNSWSEPNLNAIIPSEYKSSFSGGRQFISLPLVAYTNSIGSSIQFRHITSAILVRVRNNTGEPIYLDSVIVQSKTQQLCGNKVINLVSDGSPVVSATEATNSNQKKVKVSFSNESVLIINGGTDIKEVQVPILPIISSSNDLTIRVYTHSKKERVGIPTVNYDYDFELSTDAPTLERNVMATIQVDINTHANNSRITEVDHSLFSVADNGDGTTRQIRFSKGNLKCSRLNIEAPWNNSNIQWRFLEPQYAIVETPANPYCTEEYGDKTDVSLFSWGTSGNGEAICIYPYNTNQSDGNYGPQINSGDFNYITYDWGYNAISNGGNQIGMWRTMTALEWDYLLVGERTVGRTNANNKKGLGSINGINGLIILPDSWIIPEGCDFIASTSTYSNNTYTPEQWGLMEASGAIFLPSAGGRNGTRVNNDVGQNGLYWTSTAADYYTQAAYYTGFNSGSLLFFYSSGRADGRSVRLIQDK